MNYTTTPACVTFNEDDALFTLAVQSTLNRPFPPCKSGLSNKMLTKIT